MQRYPAASCGGGVSNSATGGASSRENARAESSFSTSNFPLNTRRQPQLSAYKLKCDREPLNSRLGPPDFYPQTPNCPEETLTKEYLQSGYKETVEGIEIHHIATCTEMAKGLIWATAEDLARNRGRVLSLYRQILRSLNSPDLPLTPAARLAKKAEVRTIFLFGSEERSLYNIADLIDAAEYSLSILKKGRLP